MTCETPARKIRRLVQFSLEGMRALAVKALPGLASASVIYSVSQQSVARFRRAEAFRCSRFGQLPEVSQGVPIPAT